MFEWYIISKTPLLQSIIQLFPKKHKDILDIISKPFKDVVEKGKKGKSGEKAIDWKWIEAIENHEHQDLHRVNKKKGMSNTSNDGQYRLIALLIVNTGLTFINLGKKDILK